MSSSIPFPTPAVRQINNTYWIHGQQYLEENPLEKRICVYFQHHNPDMKWEYFVVRTGTTYEFQTWLNGVRVN
jgi:hypothetical protein